VTSSRCVFCQRSEPEVQMTDEDVISKWFDKALTPEILGPGRSAKRTYINKFDGSTRNKRWPSPQKLSVVKIKAVCQACNNGWMSRLDARAKSILSPAISGRGITIDPEQQIALATWITMKSMVLESGPAWGVEAVPSFSIVDREVLMSQLAPPARTQARIAAIQTEGYPVRLYHRTYVRGGPKSAPQSDELAICVTMTVGCLVVQTFVDPQEINGGLLRGPVAARNYIQIFPPVRESISWPPAVALTDESIEEFANPLGV